MSRLTIDITEQQHQALKAAIDEGLASGPSSRTLDDIWGVVERRCRVANG